MIRFILLLTSVFLFLSCDDSSQDNNNNIHVVVCGDRVAEGEEECDGTDLKGFGCESLGFYGGELSCDDECKYVLDDCKNYGICGDGKLDEAEECDSFELNGKTCTDFGYYDGILACSNKCKYAFGNCEVFGWCGNNSVENPPEDCDGSLPEDITCESLGYYRGTASCGDDCKINSELCEKCGDEIIQSGDGETCDGSNLGDNQCSDIGMLGNNLSCNYMCQADYTGCEYYYRFGTPSLDDGIAAVMDSDGDFYVTLSSDGTMFPGETDVWGINVYVARLDHYGRFKWVRKVDTSSPITDVKGCFFDSPELTSDNNIVFPYCTLFGHYAGNYKNYGKYTKDGTLLWESDLMSQLVVGDASGFLYSASSKRVGSFDPEHIDLFINKFSSDGTAMWEVTLTSPNDNRTQAWDMIYCDGSLYISMNYDMSKVLVSGPQTTKLSIAKYDLQGNIQWLYHFLDIDCRYSFGDGTYTLISQLKCVPGEGVLFAGSIIEPRYAPSYANQVWGTDQGYNFLGKLSFDGTPLWADFFFDLISKVYDIETDSRGNIYIGGEYDIFDSVVGGFFLTAFDYDGNFLKNRIWSNSSSNGYFGRIKDIDIDDYDNVFSFAHVAAPLGDATPVASQYGLDIMLIQTRGQP